MNGGYIEADLKGQDGGHAACIGAQGGNIKLNGVLLMARGSTNKYLIRDIAVPGPGLVEIMGGTNVFGVFTNSGTVVSPQ